MRSPRVKRAVAYGVLLVVLVTTWPLTRCWVQSRRARAQAIDALASAVDADSLRQAVGGLGVVIPITGGQWIAVRYKDSHQFPGWSKSVALSSDDDWFESEVHFCGRFCLYRMAKEEFDAGMVPTEPAARVPDLGAIEAAESLERAKGLLVDLGFRSASISRTPSFNSP